MVKITNVEPSKEKLEKLLEAIELASPFGKGSIGACGDRELCEKWSFHRAKGCNGTPKWVSQGMHNGEIYIAIVAENQDGTFTALV